MIKDQVGKRPILFSVFDRQHRRPAGLTPYLVSEGLVRRLMPAPGRRERQHSLCRGTRLPQCAEDAQTRVRSVPWRHAAARKRARGWVDAPSQSSLLGYVFVYDTMAAALRDREPALAVRAREMRDAILANTTYAIPRPN